MNNFVEQLRLAEKATEDIYFAKIDRELIESLHRRLQAEKYSCQPSDQFSAEERAKASPAVCKWQALANESIPKTSWFGRYQDICTVSQGARAMSVMISKILHRASKCPFACFMKFLLSITFIYALHVAAYHQADVPLYSYVWLVNLFAVTAVLAIAFHWNCRFRNSDIG